MSREPRDLEAAAMKTEDIGTKIAAEDKRGRERRRAKAGGNGREEKREEIAQLSDAQITMQIPTDSTERKRRDEGEKKGKGKRERGCCYFWGQWIN